MELATYDGVNMEELESLRVSRRFGAVLVDGTADLVG
jgi:hypothetical protein